MATKKANPNLVKKERKKPVKNPPVPLPRNTPKWDLEVENKALIGKGGMLMGMLEGRGVQLGHNRKKMAEHLGVTFGYLAQLSSGHRKPEHISKEFADACARYLGTPRLTVLLAAGVITPEDAERREDLAGQMQAALKTIGRDNVYAPLLPPLLLSPKADLSLQFFVIRLYERASKLILIPGGYDAKGKPDLKAMMAQLKSLEPRRARRMVSDEGQQLLAMISSRALELGQTRKEMAEELGVTYGYIAQLTTGHRKTEHISREFANACAEYLGVTKFTILLAAGVIKPEDAFEDPDELELLVKIGLKTIKNDEEWGPIMPEVLLTDRVDQSMRFFVIRLFEKATGRVVFRGEHQIPSLVQTYQRIADHRNQLLKGGRTKTPAELSQAA